MGKKAAEALDINYDELAEYLHCNHSVYMKLDSSIYYLTDVNYESWRAQDTSRINDKGHFTDCSELVSTLSEMSRLPWLDGKTLEDVFADATFFASIQE